MRNIAYASWRFIRVFLAGVVAVYAIMPPDNILSKEILILAIGSGIVALSKYLRDQFGIDIKVF